MSVLLTLLYVSALTLTLVMGSNMERKLVQELLSNYHSHLRPVDNMSQPTTINISIKLVRVFELSAKQQVLVTSTWIEQCWFDSALTWNESYYGGIEELIVMDENIWFPDVVLLNNADSSTMGKPVNQGNPLLITSNGVVRWLAPVILKSSCKLNVRYFPFDDQVCGLELSTWTSDQTEVRLNPSGEDMFQNYSESSEWILRGAYIKKSTPPLNLPSKESRSGVKYVIHIERQVFYYFFYLISPCMLVSLITIILFILPPDCGELMVVGVTLLLSLTVFFLLASTHIPETSEVVPLIGRYYSLTIIEVSCSLGLICWVLRFHHHNISSGSLPIWIRVYVLGYIAKALWCSVPKNVVMAARLNTNHKPATTTTEDIEARDEVDKTSSKKTSVLNMMADQVQEKKEYDQRREEWQLVATVINRLFLVIYIITVILTVVGIFLQIPQLLEHSNIYTEIRV